VCSAVSEEIVCNSCEACILHTISHGTTQPGEIVCELHVAQLLQTFFANCRTHQLLCCGVMMFDELTVSEISDCSIRH
jgi:hypothetical protein